ncbi:hypothetical protein JY651_46985 [Pyxidicoccus parkwayensis]|uniref:DUF7151 domain-containing protein n=1 Tax=Pyxidicoccus parkwayensis TaxID=2813578 RepID=A0ABX7NUI3_9BACT|nr:hypothetical protein [Pyxidicoccus parkwaysis]QSQ22577.1 hypothetical protein JY651_46985 [Pyxidicoccus parkwaysis]
MRRLWMMVLVLAAGCDGIDLKQLVRQHAARTRTAVEPRGAHCEHGGTAFETGLDLDDDGELDDSEVTSTLYACVKVLTSQRPESAGANCELGGQAVLTGPDLNANGALEEAEVTATEYVCATASPGVLVRTRPVPPGDKCANGGQVAHAGRDTDGDHILDDEEITSEVYGCTETDPVLVRLGPVPPAPFGGCRIEGTRVEAGSDVNRNGQLDDGELRASESVCISFNQAVKRLRPEPAGPACPTGGTAVDVGLDVDGNGTLGDSEVTATSYVCQPTLTYDGDYVVDDAADIMALKPISRIRGQLTIMSTPAEEVLLPNLVQVDGRLRITSSAGMKRVELRGLRFVGDFLFVGYNLDLETLMVGGGAEQAVWVETDLGVISNGKLTTLTGLANVAPRRGFEMYDNDALQFTGTLPYLQQLSGDVRIVENQNLQELPLANLQQVGGTLLIQDNPSLAALNGLSSLASVGGDLEIRNNDALVSLAGFNVQSVGGDLGISNNDSLTATGQLPRLKRAGSISVTGNALLESVSDMPSLEFVEGDFYVGANPKLAAVRDFRALGYVGGKLFVGGSPLLNDISGFERLLRLKRLEVRNSDALVSLAALRGLVDMEELVVQENPNLADLGLAGLKRVGTSFVVTDNAKLPTCQATALADATYQGSGKGRVIERNDDASTCGP